MPHPELFPVQLDEHRIAHVRLPECSHAADSVEPAELRELIVTLQQHAQQESILGFVIHAQGSNWLPQASASAWLAFCSTGDAAAMASNILRRSQWLRTVERLSKPVAIVVEGNCLDLCLEFALACHHRIVATREQSAQFGLPLVRRGIPPMAGATQRLPRISGIPAALPVLLGTSMWDTAAALEHKLIGAALPPEDAIAAAIEWVLAHPQAQAAWDAKGYRIPQGAGAMAAHAGKSFGDSIASIRKSTHDHQPAPLSIVTAVYEGTQLPIDAGLLIEAQCAAQTLSQPATGNQIRTLWLEQDRARQLVRRPPDVPRHEVRQLGVLGSGLMGAGIAQIAAAAGIDVVLIDTSAERAAQARDKVSAALQRSHGDKADAIARRITASNDLQRLRGSDFIIEAIYEDRSAKAGLMAEAAQVLADRAGHFVWASNTSTLPITGLAGYWPNPEQVIGMHFFSPVPRMALLEIINGEQTSSATLARAMDLAARLGKTPILVNDSPGFYTSRIFCAYIDEGMAMLAEGIHPALIENAARQAGFATSPLAVTDEVSLDLQALVIGQAQRDGLDEKFLRRPAQPVVERMNTLQRLGRKSGGGFYDYPAEGNKRLWPGLEREFPLADKQPDAATVRSRLLCMQALESARCLEESVLTASTDGDIGSILGLGYPAWTGGTLSYIDMLGVETFVRQCDALADQFGERLRPSAWLRQRASLRQGG
ncbi:3-hydroxyacyl-CoA dehydrogenase NAD-binding domain-containing protein [Diaphorobacter aerolatus]|uniref:3-hydroxyacyl-CoA dehydrogenase n=1 Tax=Diaphorobacter aerolatus TaxID=1288495 RepID=A0A7H0GJR6_9BURK|nr:3-hydroxyacyl-CoA dehydrogenase NAD-binding domain-containing protein [Diaphorobacter aerolatus]QNP48532.1 3-hydroxyacyl-CoA dehydrogenase [Diaphorobacter aerolatus]